MRTFGEAPPPPTFLERLKTSLSKTGLGEILTKKKLDAAAVAELEEALIRADMGTGQAKKIAGAVAKNRYDAEISESELRTELAHAIAALLAPIQKPLVMDDSKKPFVILVVGGQRHRQDHHHRQAGGQTQPRAVANVMLAAGDTFRAAAIEQLKIWGERTSPVFSPPSLAGTRRGLPIDAFGKGQRSRRRSC
jgi:fused signal recognition particle receptor